MKKKETVIITEVQEMCPRLESNHMPKENDDTNAESQREKRNKNKKRDINKYEKQTNLKTERARAREERHGHKSLWLEKERNTRTPHYRSVSHLCPASTFAVIQMTPLERHIALRTETTIRETR